MKPRRKQKEKKEQKLTPNKHYLSSRKVPTYWFPNGWSYDQYTSYLKAFLAE
jgi:hypothetical protein